LCESNFAPSSQAPFLQVIFPIATMTTRPSHKSPSSLLAATKASSAPTGSSCCLSEAKAAAVEPMPNELDTGKNSSNPKTWTNANSGDETFEDDPDALANASVADVVVSATATDPKTPPQLDDPVDSNKTAFMVQEADADIRSVPNDLVVAGSTAVEDEADVRLQIWAGHGPAANEV